MMLTLTNLYGQAAQFGGTYDSFNLASKVTQIDRMYGQNFNEMWNANYNTYSFKVKDRIYDFKNFIVSYEQYPDNNLTSGYNSNEKRERNLYLYRLDGDGWKIASNILQTDYKIADNNGNIISYNIYYPQTGKDDNIIILKDGTVKITLTNISNAPNNGENFSTKTIYLKSIGNEKYLVIP